MRFGKQQRRRGLTTSSAQESQIEREQQVAQLAITWLRERAPWWFYYYSSPKRMIIALPIWQAAPTGLFIAAADPNALLAAIEKIQNDHVLSQQHLPMASHESDAGGRPRPIQASPRELKGPTGPDGRTG
jgi:hypothetical protein